MTFAVVADPRGKGDTWKNALLELRDGATSSVPPFGRAELLLIAGDMDPLEERYNDFLDVFTNATTRPVFLPVIGNHEFENDGIHFRYARDVLIPAIAGAVRRHPTSCDYFFDHKNVRVIAVDAYTDLGKDGVVNKEGRKWVEEVIVSAPPAIEHIFVSLHEPAFPRYRHLGSSFDLNRSLRNAFWRMLLSHQDRVRALLVGHTHSYYRMRVLHPSHADANNVDVFPDEEGGLYQVDAGAAGNSPTNTIVQVNVVGRTVDCRVLQAAAGANQSFREVDRWSIIPPQ